MQWSASLNAAAPPPEPGETGPPKQDGNELATAGHGQVADRARLVTDNGRSLSRTTKIFVPADPIAVPKAESGQ